MNLNDFINGDRSNPANILNNLKKSVFSQLKNKKSDKDYKKLQEYLQGVFYPTSGQSKVEQKYKEYNEILKNDLVQSYKDTFDIVIKNFNMNLSGITFTGNSKNNNIQKVISREQYESYNHKNHIVLNTIKHRLERVEQALQDNQTTPDFTETENTLKELQDLLLTVIDKYCGKKDNFKIKVDKDENLKALIDKIDALYLSVSDLTDYLTNDFIGDVFEAALQHATELSVNNAENISTDLITQIFNHAGTGALKIKEDGKETKLPKVYAKITDKNKDKIKDTDVIYKDNLINVNLSVKEKLDVYSSRQGKMDVDFILKDNKKQKNFRISAKNWETMKRRDFGSTPLIYALMRSIDNDDLITEYIYAMQIPNTRRSTEDGNYIVNWHSVAKLSILVDILMGYSQKNNYSDTIVINNRAERKIIVISIKTLIYNICNRIQEFYLSDYKCGYSNIEGKKNDIINEEIYNIRQSVFKKEALNTKNEKKSEKFIRLSLSYLKSMEVTVKYNEISNFAQYKKLCYNK